MRVKRKAITHYSEQVNALKNSNVHKSNLAKDAINTGHEFR